MVQPADLRQRYDSAHFSWLNQARLGRVLSQREMGSCSAIVVPLICPASPGQQSIEACSRQIKIGEVEQVIKPGAGLHADPLMNFVGPADVYIESA
jgi:hypothetical protein